MAGDHKKASEVDIMALLNEVHGTVAGARGQTIDQALRAMEITHRQAAIAMRQFERSGRVGRKEPDDRTGLTFEPHKGPRQTGPAADAQAAASRAQAAKKQANTAPAAVPAQHEEVTALWRPPSTQAVNASSPSSTSADADPGASVAERTSAQPSTGAGPGAATSERPKPAPSGKESADDAKKPASEAFEQGGQIYGGRGADYARKEPTRTAVLPRPKR